MVKKMIICDIVNNGIESEQFRYCGRIEHIIIENNEAPSMLGHAAFAFSYTLKRIEIRKGIKTICKRCFCECRGLETVNLSKDGLLNTIESLAFMSCTSLEEVEIPSSVTELGIDVWRNCTRLKRIIVPKHLIEKYGEDYIKSSTSAKIIIIDETTNVEPSKEKADIPNATSEEKSKPNNVNTKPSAKNYCGAVRNNLLKKH